MKESTRNFLVGLFTLTALLIIAMLMVWFGEAPVWLRRGEWTLNITGSQFSGVTDGSLVYLNGVRIGRVETVDFEDPSAINAGVKIVTKIKNEYSVPVNAVAKVYGATFGLGQGRVEIIADRSLVKTVPAPSLDNKTGDAFIPGIMSEPLKEIIPESFETDFRNTVDDISRLVDEWTHVARNTNDLIEFRSIRERGVTPPAGNVSTLIQRIDNLAADLQVVLGDENVKTDTRLAVRNVAEITESIKAEVEMLQRATEETSTNLNETIDNIEQRTVSVLDELQKTAVELSNTAKNLAEAGNAISSAEGTVGRLVFDPRLYEAAVLTFERLADLTENLRVITGKVREDGYITVGARTGFGTFLRDLDVSQEQRKVAAGESPPAPSPK